MQLPTDPPSNIAPDLSLTDAAPSVTDAQRERAHRREWTWRGKPLHPWSLEREIFWRELRAHEEAPAIASYQTIPDFLPEAVRILWIASATDDALRALRQLTPEAQRITCVTWAAKNITLEESFDASRIGHEIYEAVALQRTRPLETQEVDGLGE